MFFVIPIHGITPQGCTCTNPECNQPGTHPAVKWKNLTEPPPYIAQGMNRAALTGPRSGCWVLDVDVKDGRAGMDSIALLEEIGGEELPVTLMVQTPSGGFHYYFAWDPNRAPVKNSVGELGEGLDVRGDNGLVLIPPSEKKVGVYAYLNDAPIAPAPEWLYSLIERAKKYRGRVKAILGKVPEGKRNDSLIRWAGWLRGVEGLDGPLLEWGVRLGNAVACDPPLGEEEILSICSSVAQYEAGDPSSLGAIDIIVSHLLGQNQDLALEALARDPEIYARAGEIVSVYDAVEGAKIVPHTRDSLNIKLATAARWWKNGKDELIPTTPDFNIVGGLVARGHYPELRDLRGTQDVAYLGPNGKVVSTKGYDPTTGLLLVRDDPFAPMPIGEAIRALNEVIEEFPFATPSDHSAWIAWVLTLLSRWAHRGDIPMYFTEAPRPGSGKSKLVSVGLIIAGHATTRKVWCREEEEQRKELTRMARDGTRICFYDNVSGVFGSDALLMALTGNRTWNDRILGKSAGYNGPLELIFAASGNNATVKEDLTRRMMISRIVPECDNPSQRPIQRKNLEDWVKQNAPRLRRAALSILQGFLDSGAKPNLAEWGSFEEWSRIVRGAVVWAGYPDPIEAAGHARAEDMADEGDETLEVILDYLREHGPLSASDILSHMSGTSMRDRTRTKGLRAIWRAGTASTPIDIGKRLGVWKDRMLRGEKLVCRKRNGVRTWGVERLRPPTP